MFMYGALKQGPCMSRKGPEVGKGMLDFVEDIFIFNGTIAYIDGSRAVIV